MRKYQVVATATAGARKIVGDPYESKFLAEGHADKLRDLLLWVPKSGNIILTVEPVDVENS